jgi:hypothetical protein
LRAEHRSGALVLCPGPISGREFTDSSVQRSFPARDDGGKAAVNPAFLVGLLHLADETVYAGEWQDSALFT